MIPWCSALLGEPADGNMNALLAGECDVVDQNMQFLEMFPGLLEREAQQKLKTYVGQGPEWEHLDFGIRPAAYDDGYNPAAGDRPDLFGDPRVRQAFAYCIDRQAIVDDFLYGRSDRPEQLFASLPPAVYQQICRHMPYDPDRACSCWMKLAGKTLITTRLPHARRRGGHVPDGTPLSVNLPDHRGAAAPAEWHRPLPAG